MPRKSALLIGVSDYGEGFEPLTALVKDVAALQRVLENPEMGRFDEVKVLTDPGLVKMRREIGTLFSTSQKDDLVLLFFSGHGVADDSYRLYLTTRLSSKDSFQFDSLEASYIQNFSDSAYAKRQVIILDCCYSGAFADGWQRKGAMTLDLERELGKEGRVVLTSSSSTQVSFQQEDGELSLYTQYLVEGIETGAADGDNDGEIRVRELHEYAKRKVQAVKPKMTPDIIVADDQGYDIVLSRVKLDAAGRFRREVEKYADHGRGEIRNSRCQEILDTKAREWGISTDEATRIITSVLEPSRRRLRSLARYQQEYEKEIALQGYPLDKATEEELRDWQQTVLGLEDQDVYSVRCIVEEAHATRLANSFQGRRQRFEQAVRATIAQYPIEEISLPKLKRLQQDLQLPEGVAANIIQQAIAIADGAQDLLSAANFGVPELSDVDKQLGRLSQPDRVLSSFAFETAKVISCQKKGGFLGVGGEVVCDVRRQAKTAQEFSEDLSSSLTLKMIEIPAGHFTMGSPREENGHTSEKPQHKVLIPPLFVSKFAVTQAQYEAVTGLSPAKQYYIENFASPSKPVIGVTWYDAIAFCEALSQKTGRSYRLLSEAEWEYACRAETQTPFCFGETITADLVNYDGNYAYGHRIRGVFRQEPISVGRFPANSFGLFDMHGNVWEWCLDYWHETYQDAPIDGSTWEIDGDDSFRVIRGGSWKNGPIFCRSAFRFKYPPTSANHAVGFRVCTMSA